MQLFITNFKINWDKIDIENSEILDQIRKVLRMKIWDTIFIQNNNTRFEIEITNRNDKCFWWKIINEYNFNQKTQWNSIAIAMPNKWDKIELLVQKITEIWIKNIYFWPSERSIIRERNEKKHERLKKIAKEAVEQSWWRFTPEITFIKNISEIIEWKNIVVFDKTDNIESFNDRKFNKEFENTLWIIWPEWWLTENDYKNFRNNYKTISLWDTVLRAETAGIIASRLLKNINLI